MKPIEHFRITRKNIWNFRQNHPELVVRDLREKLGLNEEQCQVVRDSLLARGVNKWLKVRRDLIAYKKLLKHEIAELEAQRLSLPRHSPERSKLLAVQNRVRAIRKDLKALCMTDRWQIWPESVGDGLRQMNSITAADR